MLKLIEPNRGITLIKNLNNTMNQSPILAHRTPILADVFVFSYPVYLAALYIAWRVYKNINYKKSALFIFTSVLSSTVANIIIQYFVEKSRPNIVLELVDLKKETPLHQYLPSSSFPSDHAAVSMSIAIASIIRGIAHKDQKYLRFGGILIGFSIIMCTARVATAVHRPTDIIGGMLVGILIPIILSNKKIFTYLDKIFTWIGKKI